jgi:hypothetical protein
MNRSARRMRNLRKPNFAAVYIYGQMHQIKEAFKGHKVKDFFLGTI